jgi:hypothetical protein
MTLESYMSTLVHENAIKNVVIIRDNAVGTSRLVHENAIKNGVIIRDDAFGTSTERPEYDRQQIEKAHQRPSFTNHSERNNAAPKLPDRKSSYDDLHLKSNIKEGGRSRRSSLNALPNRKPIVLPNRKGSYDDADLFLMDSDRNRRTSLNSFLPMSDARNKKGGTLPNMQSRRHTISPNGHSRRKLIDEIFAEVGVLFEESQKRSRFDHAE